MVEILGSVFHHAVFEPRDDHAECFAQRNEVIAMHARMGYRADGAYNGHLCWHGERWRAYWGPNQASGNDWANLNLDAWCYLATVGTPLTALAQQAAYDCTLDEPQGRDQIYPHSAFYPTFCCGDPLREWIAAGALAPVAGLPTERIYDMFIAVGRTIFGVSLAFLVTGGRVLRTFDGAEGGYGIPQSALDWKGQDGRDAVPYVFVDADQVAQFSAPWPTVLSGGSVTVPAGPLKVTLTGSATPA